VSTVDAHTCSEGQEELRRNTHAIFYGNGRQRTENTIEMDAKSTI